MDINTVRGLSTVFVFLAFIGVCWWAFSPKRKKKFDEAANLPFADDEQSQQSARKESEQHRGE
ncbi:cbb3-type cytochrome oxidase subunit 3 [Agaribacterium haliotis]|uniref:cbb3-type cytochrome oxidase subunit 3 n=1 Tax=Agaribacterium haliotis TaxID=2013869 RepID=UPI000BB59D43|nr:cbb3-type cytochrome c oxidase subunit 3 [Agaribacterium haliotis]